MSRPIKGPAKMNAPPISDEGKASQFSQLGKWVPISSVAIRYPKAAAIAILSRFFLVIGKNAPNVLSNRRAACRRVRVERRVRPLAVGKMTE